MRIYVAIAVALVFFVGSGPAHGRTKKKKRGVGSIVIVSAGTSWKMAAGVLEAVEKSPHGMTTRSILLERDNPQEDIAFLRTLLGQIRKARRSIFKLRLKPAIRRLKRVIAKIKPLIVQQGTKPGLLRRYMQAYNYLGAAYQLNANTFAAKAAFRIVLSIDPDRKLKAKYFTAEVIATFEKLKRSLRKGGTLRVNTDGSTLVIVDGRLRGVAPVVIQGLHPGEHIVELRRLGYLRITRFVTVDAQTGGTLKARVVKDLNESALRKQMETVEKALRQSKRPVDAVAKLAALLKVNQILLCRASLDDGEASLFDADTKKFVKRVRRISALPGTPPSTNIATALKNRTPTLDLQGGLAASGGSCEDSDDCTDGYCLSGQCVSETPVYKKWWFWTVIGLAVGAVAGGAAILGTMPQRPTIQITVGGR
jgi:tetratricopeptide (TPR) repeat protein